MAAGRGSSQITGGKYTIRTPLPTISPVTGTYPGPITVTLMDPNPAAKLYYTTDGTIPTDGTTLPSNAYNGPFQVPAGTTVRAIAYAPDSVSSLTVKAIYHIPAGGPAARPK